MLREHRSSAGCEGSKSWLATARRLRNPFVAFLPQRVYREMGLRPTVATGDPKLMWWYATCYNVVVNVYYYFLMYFTFYFREHATPSNSIPLFLLYVAFGTVMRIAIKRIGLVLDLNKRFSASMYFVGEVLCLLFYFTFYRVLFESVTSFGVFFAIQAVHLLSEWALYPLRGSAAFFNYATAAKESSHPLVSLLGLFVSVHGLGYQDWIYFIALDFGIRVVVLVVTGRLSALRRM